MHAGRSCAGSVAAFHDFFTAVWYNEDADSAPGMAARSGRRENDAGFQRNPKDCTPGIEVPVRPTVLLGGTV